jgi:hypothetical protein
MKIKQEGYFMPFLNADNEILHSFNLWEILKVSCMKVSIKVLPKHSSAMVAKEHSIWIHHWNYIEIKMVCQSWKLKNS